MTMSVAEIFVSILWDPWKFSGWRQEAVSAHHNRVVFCVGKPCISFSTFILLTLLFFHTSVFKDNISVIK